MADPLGDLSTSAEDAIADIRLIAHDYVTAQRRALTEVRRGRFGGLAHGFGDRGNQLAIANVVGIVEHYAEGVLLDAGSKPSNLTSWPSKVKQWDSLYGTDVVNDCASFVPMWGFYDARNAIMHRRGELTHQQRKQEVYDRLAAAGIERVGYHVVVNPPMVASCASVCVACVRELDSTLP